MAEILSAHRVSGPLGGVAAQREDKFVLYPYNESMPAANGGLLVITNAGDVFYHSVTTDAVSDAIKFNVPPDKVASREQDHWVRRRAGRILVITQDGQVFAHDVPDFMFIDSARHHTVDPARQLSGPPVAANQQDKYVFPTARGLMVITQDGEVFGHDITADGIGPSFKYGGDTVAARPGDKWVLVLRENLIVITESGEVFCHPTTRDEVKPAFPVAGPPGGVATNPADRYVFGTGNAIFVITTNGDVFAHPTTGFAPHI